MGLFSNKEKKIRKDTKEWVQLGQKILDYRRDLLAEDEVEKIEVLLDKMQECRKAKPFDRKAAESKIQELEPLLKNHGGSFYPQTWWAENTEVLLVATILAIGIRTFFFQPFKIPTNSMYPTYNGMTAHVYEEGEDPGLATNAFRFLRLGAKHFDLEAPADGEVLLSRQTEVVPARKWLVIPTKNVRYTFIVGGEEVPLDLPLEFDVRQVTESFLGPNTQRTYTSDGKPVFRTGKVVREGESFLQFDLLTGDQLFVDRVSYHFVRPEVGDPIVFRTDNIEHMVKSNRGKYYIKRAVAGPRDVLSIEPPALKLNDEAITGSVAFEKNANQEGEYPGYIHVGPSQNYPLPRHPGEDPIQVPENHYFAMGDNSPHSADSRMWGFVPEREIVGKAFFIYYPFSHRWGPAK